MSISVIAKRGRDNHLFCEYSPCQSGVETVSFASIHLARNRVKSRVRVFFKRVSSIQRATSVRVELLYLVKACDEYYKIARYDDAMACAR